MYSAVLPSYDAVKDSGTEKFDESVDANDPDNFNDEQDEIVI